MHPVQMNKIFLDTISFPDYQSFHKNRFCCRSKLLSPLTLTNDKQMEDIRFDEIKYSHPLWDELSETIFFKNIQ